MIGKPDLIEARPFPLANVQVLELSGRDAASFLQAQTMNDVAVLADGCWQWNGCLSPRGRLLALFALLRHDAGRFWVVLPDVGAEDLARQLRRYVFRAKVALQPRTDIAALGAIGAAARTCIPQGGQALAGIDDGVVALDMGGAEPRQLLLSTGAASPPPDAPEAVAHWRRLDLAHGLPRLDAAQHDAFTPQMLSLERLGAFSLTKGCYPGQEIVARTHYLGQARRTLHLLAIDGAAAAGDTLEGATLEGTGATLGTLASVAPDADGTLALAVAAALPANAQLRVAGATAHARALLDGLAR
jgi:hypothetical protein